ncbi:MAG: dipeptide epimerase [Gemmataceae bacterium]
MVKVREWTAHQVRIRLKKPIRHASHTRTETDNLVVRCVLEDGTVGFGEGVPREYVTGESIDSALQLLGQAHLGRQLDLAQDFAHALEKAESFTLPAQTGDLRGIRGNAARCAVELAWLDACGRHFHKPISEVTALLAPDCHEERLEVRYSGVITSARGWKLKVSAGLQRLYGLKHIKVKVGIPGQDDVRRLRAVRAWAGPTMNLRIDANEAWSPQEAAARIQELEAFGITSVEQPLAQENDQALPALRRAIHTPVMLDESLCGMEDGKRAIAEGWCDLFNVRISKCGGFIPSLRLVQLAKKHGLQCQLGCQVGETAILSAAGRHFASSVSGLRYLEGSYDRRLVRDALGKTDITFGTGGRAPALLGGGLGLEFDEEALRRASVQHIPLN